MRSWRTNIFKKLSYSFSRELRTSSEPTLPAILNNHPEAEQLRSIIIDTKERAENV